MKRYFLVADGDMPDGVRNFGHWHAIDLGTHGAAGGGHHAVVLLDSHIDAPASWLPLPRATDAKTPISARVPGVLLEDLGLTGGETTAEAIDVLERIHPLFRH